MTRWARTSLALLLGASALLTGCAGASTRFFTLDPVAPSATVAPTASAPQALRIDAVHIPPALDRAELVHEIAPGRVAVNDNDHWAGPLGELMRRVLTQDLIARLGTGAVIFPDAPKPVGAGGLVVDVLAISTDGGGATMDVSWTVLPAHTGAGQAAPPSRQYTERLTAPGGSGGGDIATKISALMGRLADQIAVRLTGLSNRPGLAN